MKIISVIGTRPQYIKLKPWYDFLLDKTCDHIVIDTNQHFSENVSSIFVKEFGLEIDVNLSVENTDSIDFMQASIQSLKQVFIEKKPDIVVVMGDTNTTLVTSLVANKMEIPVAHIEAGIRCGSRKRPEEINRILTDNLSDIHFTAREKDNVNVENPFYVGDLEYVLLNDLDNKSLLPNNCYENFILMTIHRHENININKLNKIFETCRLSSQNFIFPMHHRTNKFVKKNNINIPNNIKVIHPMGYFDIIKLLSKCKGFFSDSGGLAKIAPFFGKKCLIPSDYTEYNDLEDMGYLKLGMDMEWISGDICRNKNIYYVKNSCEIMYSELNRIR